MINLTFDGQKDLKQPELKYQVGLLDGRMFEADSLHELVAVICGETYLDCDCAETEWHMRAAAAKKIGLSAMMAREMEAGFPDGDDDDEETIIRYDERIGKIPYSYTDAVVDYEIHGTPDLIRVECDGTFILSLEKARLIAVWELVEGEYQRYIQTKDLDAEIEKLLPPFREALQQQGRVPLHKKLEDYNLTGFC